MNYLGTGTDLKWQHNQSVNWVKYWSIKAVV